MQEVGNTVEDGMVVRVTYRYFMPVCLPVDSLREMWLRGVKWPKLRAMMATVRNLARAAFTTLGLVALCLPWSPLRPFRLWSVHAMDTCMAAAGGGRRLGALCQKKNKTEARRGCLSHCLDPVVGSSRGLTSPKVKSCQTRRTMKEKKKRRQEETLS